MINKRIPQIGEIKYYMKAKVSVERVWGSFHLAEVKELQIKQYLIVDICTLFDHPGHTRSISLWLLGGSK